MTKQLLKLTFSAFIFLLSLEFFLFLASLYYKNQNLKMNLGSNISSNDLVIVTLGESTTSNVAGTGSWPRQLEKLLGENKISSRVINLAEPASSAALQAVLYEKQLALTPKHILISMLGINDSQNNLFYKKSNHYQPRLFKYIKYLRANRLASETLNSVPIEKFSSLQKMKLQNLSARMKQENKIDYAAIELLQKDFPDIKKEQILSHLAHELKGVWGQPAETYKISYELFKKTLESNFESDFLPEVIALAKIENDIETCEFISKKLLGTGSQSQKYISGLSVCLNEDNIYLKRLIADIGDNSLVLNTNNGLDNLLKNMNALFEMAKSQENCWIMMQYPLEGVPEIENIFQTFPEKSHIYFLKNKSNFEQALKNHKYEDLFLDHFASHFGHATFYGNSLIAQNVFEKIKEISNNDTCGLPSQFKTK